MVTQEIAEPGSGSFTLLSGEERFQKETIFYRSMATQELKGFETRKGYRLGNSGEHQ